MENMSLFHEEDSVQEQFNFNQSNSLDVVKMEFLGAEPMSWQGLFSGFDTLHAITYSSGIGFVYQLLDLFEEAEIIFGCDEVISYSLQEVMAYQYKTIERMRETAGKMKMDLVSRIDAGTLHFMWPGVFYPMKKYIFLHQSLAENELLWVQPICLFPRLEADNVKISVMWMVNRRMSGIGIAIAACVRTVRIRSCGNL